MISTPVRRSRSRCWYSRNAARCRPTAVFPVPGAPCTAIVVSRSARTSSSCSGWMVATLSRIGPTRDLGGQDLRRGAELLAAVQMLVLEAGQPRVDRPVGDRTPAEPAPDGDA